MALVQVVPKKQITIKDKFNDKLSWLGFQSVNKTDEKKKDYTLWRAFTNGILIRTYDTYYQVHLWCDEPTYVHKKINYNEINIEEQDKFKFINEVLGKTIKKN